MRRKRGRMLLAVLGVVALLGASPALANIDRTVDPGFNWIGYMNVFELPENGGAYVFGSAWGLPALPATFNSLGVLQLGPNTNTYTPGDSFWVQPDGDGNKWMDANVYVEDTTLLGDTLTFSGRTIENSLASPYTSQAFIKVLDANAGYATVAAVYAPLVTGDHFSISLAIDNVAGYIPQFGFVTDGPNANPDLDLGRVRVVPEPTSLLLGLVFAGAFILRRR